MPSVVNGPTVVMRASRPSQNASSRPASDVSTTNVSAPCPFGTAASRSAFRPPSRQAIPRRSSSAAVNRPVNPVAPSSPIIAPLPFSACSPTATVGQHAENGSSGGGGQLVGGQLLGEQAL